jgi:IS6 family transposase
VLRGMGLAHLIKGFEVMRMFKKGQFAPWIDAICGGSEARFINRLFGVYA